MIAAAHNLFDYADYRDVLRDELASRQIRNLKYSQRAFARDLGIGPNRLSEILSGKQGLSANYAKQVAASIGLEGLSIEYFCEMVRQRHARSERERKLARQQLTELKQKISYHRIRLEVFQIIADWPHLAIIELSKLPTFQPKAEWLAKKLGRTETEIKEMLHRLEKVGLLKRTKGRFVFSELNNAVPESLPSDAVKKFHEGILNRASSSLWEQSAESRDFSTTFIAFDKKLVPEVKQRIDRFWKEIDRDFGGKGRPENIYSLGVQFFSLTEARDVTH